MTKVKQNATKELLSKATQVQKQVSQVRRNADGLVKNLRAMENDFVAQREEQAAQQKREEQQRMMSTHTTAYVALDEEERAELARAQAAEEAQREAKARQEAEARQQAETEAKPEQPEAPREEPPVKAEPAAPKAEAPAEEKPAPKPQQQPRQGERKQQRGDQPRRPAIGQIMARPGQQVEQKPVGPAPNVIRMARPVNQAQGQPTRQGPYGRPANGQQYGRPANPQQGPYGRPANGQGPYGRPANGQQQGQARPVGGGYGQRPQNGTGARPAQGGRPVGGGAARTRAPEMAPAEEKQRVSNYDPNKKNYVRQHDPERVTRNRKQEARNSFSGYDDDVIRGGKRSRVKKSANAHVPEPVKIEVCYMTADTITVRDLTERVGKPAGEILKQLLLLGNMANINTELDYDTVELLCQEFGIRVERKMEKTAEESLAEENFEDTEETLETRPPVITIMGHVDHGKTSLLDHIRKTRVTAGEAGGITQHIGAYTVDIDGRRITFLDTPGHEAFTAMRARGTQATDIAVLVVAADDSVMPQTVESINHAKAADVPIIVAINKMDKPDADPERVKQDLTKYGLVCEDWGGDVPCVPVSAVTGQGIDDLLETILLEADVLELQANPNRLGRGVIIEAKLDKARGPLATVLLQNGTLHVGDNIVAGLASGRVRALINDRGEKVKSAGPSMPVEIMGFDEVPSAGDEMIAVGDDKLSRQVADERREKLRASREATAAKMTMENLFSTIEAGKVTTLNLIVKADVQGSVEAVKQAMEKLSTDEVKVRVLHSAAGAITKDDVNLASAFNAIIIGFNVRPDASARETAEREKVDIRLYTVIYKAIEDMEAAMKGLLEPEYREVLLGHAEVRNVFKITGAGIIAGCYVQDGKVQRNANVRLLRENVVAFEGKLSSLKHLKDDVKEMAAGYECGMSLEGHNDIKIGDIVECYVMEEIPR